MPENGQIEQLIERAQVNLRAKGLDDASDTDKLLAVLGWLPCAIAAELRNNGKQQGVVIRLGLPVATGAGITGIVVAVLEKLLGRW